MKIAKILRLALRRIYQDKCSALEPDFLSVYYDLTNTLKLSKQAQSFEPAICDSYVILAREENKV